MTVDTRSTIQCFHCGEVCGEEIGYRDKLFCCHGCKSVYEILSDNNLLQYYDLNKAPGIKNEVKRFDYLDNDEIADSITNYRDEDVTRVTLRLPAIHCSSCIWLLENLPRILPGVQSCQVNFSSKSATILIQNHNLKLSQLANFLASIGYTPDISIEEHSQNTHRKVGRTLRVKIAIAGFCFGNSMLISLPDYLDASFAQEYSFRVAFGILNILFALPVVFFSGWDYFKSASQGLRRNFISMDLPIAMGISALFLRSIYEIISMTGLGYVDSLTGLIFLLLIGKWYQAKTYRAFAFDRDYKSFFPIAVLKINGDNLSKHVPIGRVVEGDILQIHHDEIIPSDGKLLEGDGKIDYSFVTGESEPYTKLAGDRLYAGGRQKGTNIRYQVTKTVENSYLTSLWNQGETAPKSSVELVANRMGKYFTLGVIILSLFSGIFWYFQDPSRVWVVVSSILIVACPCALALAAPFTFGQVMRVFGRHNFYLKNVTVVEKLARCKQIVFDKTGTLTTTNGAKVTFDGDITDHEKVLVSSLTSHSLHPVSEVIYAEMGDHRAVPVENFEEAKGRGVMARVNGNIVRLGSKKLIRSAPSFEGTALEIDGQYKGLFRIGENYRPGIFPMLTNLSGRFGLFLLSGDGNKEENTLSQYFNQTHFGQKPEDKKNSIKELQHQSPTIMIGDGLNDAGALMEAETGVAVVEDLHRFSPASDAIIKGDRLPVFPRYIDLSISAMKIVYLAFGLSLLYNVVGLTFAITGHLTPLISAILMPISSVSVVALVTLLVQWRGSKLLKKP